MMFLLLPMIIGAFKSCTRSIVCGATGLAVVLLYPVFTDKHMYIHKLH